MINPLRRPTSRRLETLPSSSVARRIPPQPKISAPIHIEKGKIGKDRKVMLSFYLLKHLCES